MSINILNLIVFKDSENYKKREKSTFQPETFVYNERQRFFGRKARDSNETNCNDTGYLLCGKMLSYGCVAGDLGDGSGSSYYSDCGTLYAYDVSELYSERPDG